MKNKTLIDINKVPHADLILRIGGFIFFLAFVIHRFSILNNYGSPRLYENASRIYWAYRLLWFSETFIFILYLCAYLFRSPAKKLATGFRETVFPFITAAMPFLMIRHSFYSKFLPGYDRRFQDLTSLAWNGERMYIVEVAKSAVPLGIAVLTMLMGAVIMVAALARLWKSFSIMTEARELKTTGLYKYIRHPLYLGEFVSYLGVLMLRFNTTNVVIFILFIIMQTYRAKIEERKLGEVFPEYGSYKKRTGMFLPFV